MIKHVFAFTIAALVSSSASLFAQPRTIYHWRSFSEVASALHASVDGYQIYIEKYGPLVTTEGWPIRVHVTFNFWAIGVQGACWIPSDAFTLDQTSGEARLDATVPSGGRMRLAGWGYLRPAPGDMAARRFESQPASLRVARRHEQDLQRTRVGRSLVVH